MISTIRFVRNLISLKREGYTWKQAREEMGYPRTLYIPVRIKRIVMLYV